MKSEEKCSKFSWSKSNPIERYWRELVLLTVSVIVLHLEYGFIFTNLNYQVFEIGGALSNHPWIYLKNMYLTTWIIRSHYGYQGIGVPSYLFIFALSKLGNYIGTRVFLLALISIGEIYSYKLILKLSSIGKRTVAEIKTTAVIFSFMYVFGPVTASMIFTTAYESYLLYCVTPLMIYLILSLTNKSNGRSTSYVLIFSLVSLLVFYFNAGEIMWAPVLLSYYIFSRIILNIKKRENIFLLKQFALFIIVFALLSQRFTSILNTLTGNSLSVFSTTAFGASNISQIVVDLRGNFHGYLNFLYWYIAVLFIIIFMIVGLSLWSKLDNRYDKPIFLASIMEIITVLVVWYIFENNILSLEYFFAAYLPEVGEYIPLMGYELIVSLFLFLFALLFTRYFESVISNKNSLFRITKIRSRRGKHYVSVALILLITIMIFCTNINFLKETQPSNLSGYKYQKSFRVQNEIPSDVYGISSWFYHDTNINNGYRVFIAPYGVSTANAIVNQMPWTYFVNLSKQAGTAVTLLENHNSTDALANILSTEAVKYVIVDKGPYVERSSPSSNYKGPARFQLTGWPWQLQYVPIGGASNWSSLLSKSSDFRLVSNLSGAFVFQNLLYQGALYAYDLPNKYANITGRDVINPVSFNIFTRNLLIHSNLTVQNGSWTPGGSTHSWESWFINNQTRTVIYEPNKTSITSAYLSAPLKIKENEYYHLSYSLKGKYMTNSEVVLRFFSGTNQTGKIIYTWGSNTSPKTVTNGNLSNYISNEALFETPSNFSSAQIYLTVHPKNATNSMTTANFHNLTITFVEHLSPRELNYSFVSSGKALIHSGLLYNTTALIVLDSNYNGEWELKQNAFKVGSIPIFNGQLVENAFVFNDTAITNNTISILFQPQVSYQMYLVYFWLTFSFFMAVSLILYYKPKRVKMK